MPPTAFTRDSEKETVFYRPYYLVGYIAHETLFIRNGNLTETKR